jgi:hypothetical protein
MAQLRQNLSLAHEHANEAIVLRVLREQQLDHDGLDETDRTLGARQINHAHAALGELAHHSVTPEQKVAYQVVGGRSQLRCHRDPVARLK